MALTLEQESALLALLNEKRITLPELSATAEVKANDLFLTNQLLADKSVTAKVLKDYIAPQSSTDQIGIVQLSNSIDSDSDAIAATSKAVKTVNDNANSRALASRKINGQPLTDDVVITSEDIFNQQAVSIGPQQNLDWYKTPGLYFQAFDADAASGWNHPEAYAGSLTVYKAAGVVQVYRVYNSSRVYTRAKYGNHNWTPWAREYNTENKPTAADVGAYTYWQADHTFSFKNSAVLNGPHGWWRCGQTGLIHQWGQCSVEGDLAGAGLTVNSTYTQGYHFPFPNCCAQVNVIITNADTRDKITSVIATVQNFDNWQMLFQIRELWSVVQYSRLYWYAVGY